VKKERRATEIMDMFSILTADAAAKHGHEFSRAATMPVGGQQTPKARLPIPRSPLSVLPRARSPNISRPRQRPQSMKITMAELKEDLEGEQAVSTLVPEICLCNMVLTCNIGRRDRTAQDRRQNTLIHYTRRLL
jgi:hypothetical protein